MAASTAAIMPPPGGYFPTPPNLSSTSRPGSILFRIGFPPCRLKFSPDCRTPHVRGRGSPAIAAARLRRTVSGVTSVPAPASAKVLPIIGGPPAAGPRCHLLARLYRTCPCRRDRRSQGSRMREHRRRGEAKLVLIGNPNNPDGRLWSQGRSARARQRLQAAWRAARRRRGVHGRRADR